MHAHALSLLEDHLKPGMKALDVGSGSGVLCSMMCRMVTEGGASGKIVGIDYIKALVDMADRNIRKGSEKTFLENGTIVLHQGDGWKGVPESAPYDAIHVEQKKCQKVKQNIQKVERNIQKVTKTFDLSYFIAE